MANVMFEQGNIEIEGTLSAMFVSKIPRYNFHYVSPT